MDQIDRYQNIGTKLTVTLKYKDKNSVFANKLLVFNFFINQKKKKNPYFHYLVSLMGRT